MRNASKRAKSSIESISVEEGSGNVFADLGLKNPEERLAKAQLVSRISQEIEKRQLTQVEAAAILEINQPKISDLLRGRLKGFSIERLVRFLNKLDQDVTIVVHEKARQAKAARLAISLT